MKKNYICCVAGRSGGHIIPCITIAEKSPHKESLLFFTSNTLIDKQILKNYKNITFHITLPLMNVPYNIKFPLFIAQAFYCFLKSFLILIRHRPVKIISTGGYISIPVCFAGFLLRIPIEIYELNAVPGKATKLLAYIACKIFICFQETKNFFKQKTTFYDYPVRFIKEPNILINGKNLLPNYTKTKKTILILGGSQGSDFINQQLCQFIFFNQDKFQIIHQTGSTHVALLTHFYKENNVSAAVFSYHQNLQDYYYLSDLIICRSGAGTLFETLFFKKKCITIPLETKSTDHQLDNALALSKEYPQLFYVLRQKELLNDPFLLSKTVLHYLHLPNL